MFSFECKDHLEGPDTEWVENLYVCHCSKHHPLQEGVEYYAILS